MYIDPFGNIDIDNLEECYDSLLEFHGEYVDVDLNFEGESIEETDLEYIKKFISGIETFAKKAFEAISDNFDLGDESETARLYLKHHLEEFTEETVKKIFGTTDVDKNIFINNLKLYRVGLYPEDDESSAIFDIQLPRKYTNYLIAVTFDKNGKLSHISMES